MGTIKKPSAVCKGIHPSTSEAGFVVITKRANVQKVVSQLKVFYDGPLREYSARNVYHINGVIEMWASALDRPHGILPDGETPLLSAVRLVKDRPDLDTAVWIAILSFKNAPHQNEAFQKIENFF